MSFESRDYLRHMALEADYLIGRSAGLSYEAFAADETLRRAFVRSLEIIGEAAKKVVGSDGLPLTNGGGHPRRVGTYARVLGRYVREQKRIDLTTALRKISLMPAERLERFVPAMRRKGRLAVGLDADVTVFDPARVIDRATFENPAQFSEGIHHVIVGGTFVVRDQQLASAVAPGRPIRNTHP